MFSSESLRLSIGRSVTDLRTMRSNAQDEDSLVTRTATRSCLTRKWAFYFYSAGDVRRSNAAARHVRTLSYATAAAAAGAAVYRQFGE